MAQRTSGSARQSRNAAASTRRKASSGPSGWTTAASRRASEGASRGEASGHRTATASPPRLVGVVPQADELAIEGAAQSRQALAGRQGELSVADRLPRLLQQGRPAEQRRGEEPLAGDLAAGDRAQLRRGQHVVDRLTPGPSAIEGARQHVHGAARERHQHGSRGLAAFGRRAHGAVAAQDDEHVGLAGQDPIQRRAKIRAQSAPDLRRR